MGGVLPTPDAGRQLIEDIFARVSDGFIALDRDGRCVYLNPKAVEALGRSREELTGKDFWAQFPELVNQPVHLACQQALRDQKPIERQGYAPRFDRWFEVAVHPATDGVSIYFRDITVRQLALQDLENSRAQLRALGSRLQSLREEERTRMAREIHDNFGQALTGLKMDLTWVRKRLDASSLQDKVQALVLQVDQMIDQVQEMCVSLRPAVLDDMELAAALRWELQRWQARSGVTSEFCEDTPTLPAERERTTALFRIFQEILSNVARHAGATHVEARLSAHAGDLVLTVRDNGRGITGDELASPRSLGLLGMKERAGTWGGSVAVAGVAGKGTTVTVRLPVS